MPENFVGDSLAPRRVDPGSIVILSTRLLSMKHGNLFPDGLFLVFLDGGMSALASPGRPSGRDRRMPLRHDRYIAHGKDRFRKQIRNLSVKGLPVLRIPCYARIRKRPEMWRTDEGELLRRDDDRPSRISGLSRRRSRGMSALGGS